MFFPFPLLFFYFPLSFPFVSGFSSCFLFIFLFLFSCWCSWIPVELVYLLQVGINCKKLEKYANNLAQLDMVERGIDSRPILEVFPLSFPYQTKSLFPSYFLPILPRLIYSLQYPSHINNTNNFLPFSFPCQQS